jgi:CPA2 family monovalent cation:H+ antiporter-2
LGAPLGITLSAAVGLGVGTLVGWTTLQGVAIGIVVSVASTMVLARLLTDRGELRSAHGQVMIGITLVEDLAVVVLTVLLPVLGTLEPGRLVAIGTAVGMGLLVLVPFAYLAARVVPRILALVARTESDELFLLVALAIGFGTAAVAQAVGLSLALGAFLAGLMISGSEHEHQTLGRLFPLRDVFVALFFVTIGALIDVSQVAAHPGLLATIVGLIVVGKLVVWTLVVWLFRYPFAAALRVAVGLTQIGEFSFILVQVARTAGHVGDDVYSATLAASLVTILLNALLVRGLPGLAARALPEDSE